ALVAMDAVTGQILALSSFVGPGADSEDKSRLGNLAVRASFPAASIFKVVTATAAIDRGRMTGNSIIQFTGSNHTLYRGNVLSSKSNRWTRNMKLSDAFAKSVNTVFAKLGVFHLGPQALNEYAERFGFNQAIPADLPVDIGRVDIPDDAWGIAEVASGFTRDTTMSPVQGAMIAAAIANDGVMMEPYIVQRVRGADEMGTQGGGLLYEAIPRQARVTFDPTSAREIRNLMVNTIDRGTSRRSFRGFNRGPARGVEVGGKTGSLTGYEPFGKYDWFVGYATGRGRSISIAVMTAHRKYWKVKSSYLARKFIESYYRRVPNQNIERES
ncbi:MAG: penicillin-binding transpeptidase domain-containing protein, partial [Bdellovibrionota bacterium]